MTAKRKFLIPGMITALVLGLILIGTLCLTIHPYFYGLHKISARADSVYVRCTEFHSCSIESAGRDATTLRGEREVPINGDLGDYVVRVSFGDAEVAGCFSNKYASYTTYKIGNSGFSFMYAYNASHGFEIFIGSDTPINESDIVVKGIRRQTNPFTVLTII